jgi:hypothetical protein
MGNYCVKSTDNSRFTDDKNIIERIENIKNNIIKHNTLCVYRIESSKYKFIISNVYEFQKRKINISKFPKEIMLIRINLHEDYNDICSICHENITKNSNVVKMNVCDHLFHTSCAFQTLDKCGEFCPICRSGIDYDMLKSIDLDMTYNN